VARENGLVWRVVEDPFYVSTDLVYHMAKSPPEQKKRFVYTIMSRWYSMLQIS
jgi:hypothetical protein